MSDTEELDTTNRFMVGVQGESIVILRFGQKMTKDDALNLAANLVAMADVSGEKFEKLLSAIWNT